jgi:2,4-dienoyl-CoA reductase-like NADH-dependent reductase (Old Yellow Enzyme family)
VKLADEVHKYGAKLFLPAASRQPSGGQGPRSAPAAFYEKAFIEELVESYGAAALRAKKAAATGSR